MDLERFIEAQKFRYHFALKEIQGGKKRSHWMWFVFPQIKGLGDSQNSLYFAMQNREHAKMFLNHPVLGFRLIEISNTLIDLDCKNANMIFEDIDGLKLKSSMTLFSSLDDTNFVF